MNDITHIIAPFDSIDLTKGRKYKVFNNHGFGDVEIKNDIGEKITVATSGSAWTYGAKWKHVNNAS